MARRFPGTKPGESLTFQPEAIPGLREDPNPSRFGKLQLDEAFVASFAKGQLQECLVRMDPDYEPVLYMGRNRMAAAIYINEHPERWEEWGISAPVCLRAKYIQKTREQAEELGIEENLERNELRAVDKANLAQRYADNGWDKAQIAKRLKLTTSRVTQLLDLFALGDDAMNLIADRKLTEAAARALMGLSAEVVADVVAKIHAGAKPHAVLAEIRELHRAKGRARPRSGRDMIKAFEDLGGDAGATLKAWASGDVSVGDLSTVLKGLGVRP